MTANQEQFILDSALNVSLANGAAQQRMREGGWGLKFFKTDADRSDKQNALSFKLYEHVSIVRKEDTILGVRCFCKYKFGVPILIADDPEMMDYFKTVFEHLSYESRIKAVRHIPVTSLMKVKQFARYLDNVYKNYESEGMTMPKPDDLYFDALMKEKKHD